MGQSDQAQGTWGLRARKWEDSATKIVAIVGGSGNPPKTIVLPGEGVDDVGVSL